MKQVWRADDGTIFDKEIDCERYEDRLAHKETLEKALADLTNTPSTVITVLIKATEKGHGAKLINFIKSIGVR